MIPIRHFATLFVTSLAAVSLAVVPEHKASGNATAFAVGYPNLLNVSNGYGAIPTSGGSAQASTGFNSGGVNYNSSFAAAVSSSSYGTLHASATAGATINPKYSGLGFYANASHGQATAMASFVDEITLTSGSLPKGTLVTYTMTLSLHANFLFQNPTDYGTASAFAMNNSMGIVRSGKVGEVSQIVSYRSGKVGDKITIDGQLSASAYSGAAFSYPNSTVQGSATVDAANTSSLFITMTTPGSGFSSLSGSSYQPAAVPEPASFAALAVGLVGVLRKRAKRRS